MSFHHGTCQLYCGRMASVSLCGRDVCAHCVATVRAIAQDAGVPFDARLVGTRGRRMVAKQNNRQPKRGARKLMPQNGPRTTKPGRRSST